MATDRYEKIAVRLLVAGVVIACIWMAALFGVAVHFLTKIW